MSDQNNERPTVSHTDAYTRDLNGGTNETYSVDLTVGRTSDDSDEEAASRGTDRTFEHPVDDPRDLRHRTHVTAQFAARNRDETIDEEHADTFDTALLDVADTALAAAGVDVNMLPINPAYLYALLIHDGWKFDSIPALIRHLKEQQEIADSIGLTDLSESSMYRRDNALVEIGCRDAVTEAAERAVHAVWRNGYPVPPVVMDRWELDSTPVVTEHAIDSETRRDAIRNWVRVLLNDAVETLTFNRSTNTSYDIEQYIGLLAHSALQRKGITACQRTAAWLHDPGAIPDGSGLLKHIKSLRLDEIEAQFAEAHAGVFQRCVDRGVIEGSLDLAYDVTHDPWYGRSLDATIGKYRPKTDATPDWTFALLTAINRDARVCFGVKHVPRKSLYSDVLDDLLETATTHAQIKHVFADKEFYSAPVIEVLRKHIGEGWVIKAQVRESIREFIRGTPKGERGFQTNISATSATPAPNAFAIPNQLTGQQTLVHFSDVDTEAATEGRVSTHTVYLTDLDETDASAEMIKFRYDDRWSAETAMRQWKHDVHPVCKSDSVNVRVYLANIAVLFFNWHALINRSLSPRYNLPLTVTHQELLTAIREVAFADSSQ